MLYERLNSLMMFGREGTSIVSVYITRVAIELRMASVLQALPGILSADFLMGTDDDPSIGPIDPDVLFASCFLFDSFIFFSTPSKLYSNQSLLSSLQGP